MNIGQAIKTVRQTKYPELRQKAFSKCVGISQTYLSLVEKGHKQASTEVLQKISDFCEIPLPVLFWFSIEKSDVHKSKAAAFDIIKPAVDAMINTLIIKQ